MAMLDARNIKIGLRRYVGKQKQTLKYRVISPARYVSDRLHVGVTSTSSRPIRMALVSDKDAFCSEEQFYPFDMYRVALREKLNLISANLLLKDVLRAPKAILAPFDIIALKMSYRTNSTEALYVARTIRNAASDKRLIYFDGDDDICVQWPEILPFVDSYIKKHAFRDRSNYLKRFSGKSNLHDYVHRKFGHTFNGYDYGNDGDKFTLILESGPVATDQLGKIHVGYNLALDRLITNLYAKSRLVTSSKVKENDIIFRGAVKSEAWVYHLRKDVEPVLKRLPDSYRIIMPTKRVPVAEYYREMTSSKICISPFGFGEICWRDFEAVLCGCLLIKPDMGHVETNPDIFKPYETYVPVKWDFSDLAEKCVHYLENESERERIVAQARVVLDDFYNNDGFIKFISKMLDAVHYERAAVATS